MTRLLHAILLVVAVCAAPKVSLADSSGEQRARELWSEGATSYELGEFDEAARLFRDAYKAWPFPEILFNLCQAHRQARDYERAIYHCRTYLRKQPDASNRQQVIDLITEMAEMAAAQKAANDRPPEGIEHPRAGGASGDIAAGRIPLDPPRLRRGVDNVDPWYADTAGWIVTGAGVVVTGVGIGYLVHAGDLNDRADRETDVETIQQLRGDADTQRTIGGVLTAAGAASLLTGAVLLWVHDKPAAGRDHALQVTVSPTSIGLRGTF